MDKYYTPTIEEFHIGFECEIQSSWGMQKGTYPSVLMEDTLSGFSVSKIGESETLKNVISSIRVKYLDREDIESFGFTFKTEDGKTDLFINFKLNVSIIYNFETKVLRMITMDLAKSELYHEIQTDPHRIGGIIIKNKSEFKKLLTQLGLTS